MPPYQHATTDPRHPGVPYLMSPQAGDTKGMPVPPKRLKDLIEGTVDHHAAQAWPGLQEVTIRWRGSFGYLTGLAEDDNGNEEQIPLCRIEYLGDDDHWGFAIYDPATETYAPAMLRTGQPAGHPNDALDTAAIIHLAEHEQ
jgi:hypothetical protein